ncbi:MAG TPA: hypothetical protein VNA22_08880, partial [Pyrinomonadaceae bacterium]|nr:hypothetical protein [Pyrinomonadaceae bacterium]
GATSGVVATSQGNALIGTSSGAGFAAIFGENTSGSSGYGVYGKGTTGFAVYAEGNAAQSRDKGGLIKAMVYVNGDGAILRCYNGQTGAFTGNCGFTASHPFAGTYQINFGFQVSDRFYAATVQSGHPTASINFEIGDSVNSLSIRTFQIRDATDISTGLSDRPFMLIVY